MVISAKDALTIVNENKPKLVEEFLGDVQHYIIQACTQAHQTVSVETKNVSTAVRDKVSKLLIDSGYRVETFYDRMIISW